MGFGGKENRSAFPWLLDTDILSRVEDGGTAHAALSLPPPPLPALVAGLRKRRGPCHRADPEPRVREVFFW